MTKNNFPKFLSNIPLGEEKLKSNSHKKIAQAIYDLTQNHKDDIKKQIIGLEGEWGSGKSNIIKLLENTIKSEKYYHFLYDAWTHQEDLTRKSFLDELLFYLSNKSIIDINTEGSWKKKYEELNHKIISKDTRYSPKIKFYFIVLSLAIAYIALIELLDRYYFNKCVSFFLDNFNINWWYILKLVIFIFPFILIIYVFIEIYKEYKNMNSGGFKEKISELFFWSKGEKLETNSTDTILELEPSNRKFREYLSDIDKEFKDKFLLITIDNIDRLTNEKVKSIWSTINIFFADNEHEEINLQNIWLIIPYDEERVTKSFGEDEKIGKGLLEKTFAISFRVPPPIPSNWELMFKEFFKEAFGKDSFEAERTLVKSLFDKFSKGIHTPRKIINFINQLVSYHIQNESIKLRYIALFVLNKDYLINCKNTISKIFSVDYYKDTYFFEDEIELFLSIGAIAYGVSIEDAKEILLVNKIRDILHYPKMNENYNVEIYSENIRNLETLKKIMGFKRYFDDVYYSSYDSYSYQIVNISKILVELDPKKPSNNKLYTYEEYNGLWNKLYDNGMSSQVDLSSFNELQKNFFRYTTKDKAKNIFGKTIEDWKRNNFPKSNNPLFNLDFLNYCENYKTLVYEIDDFLEEEHTFNIKDLEIGEINFSPEIFLNFVKEKKDRFIEFNIYPDNQIILYFENNASNKPKLIFESLIKYYKEINIIGANGYENIKVKIVDLLIDYIQNNISKHEIFRAFEILEYLDNTKLKHMFYINDVVNILNEINHNPTNNYQKLAIINFISNYDGINGIVNKTFFNTKEDLEFYVDNILKYTSFRNILNVSVKDNCEYVLISSIAQQLINKKFKLIELSEIEYNWLNSNYSIIKDLIFNNHEKLIENLLESQFQNRFT